MYILYNSMLYLVTILFLPLFILLLIINKRYRDGLLQKLGVIRWNGCERMQRQPPGLGARGISR